MSDHSPADESKTETKERPGALGIADLQQWFLYSIQSPHEITELRVDPPPPKTLTQMAVEDIILPSKTLNPLERLQVYTDMYFWRLQDSLEDDFPGILRVVGCERFKALVKGYLTLYPSRSYTLNILGQHLPKYLSETPDLGDDRQLLIDLAKLEDAVCVAFFVDESETLRPEHLQEIPPDMWPEVCFEMSPSFNILAFKHDVNSILNAVRNEESLPSFEANPSWVAVWRKDETIWRQPMTHSKFAILDAFAEGATMGEAIERGAEVWDDLDEALEEKLFSWFADWVSEGFFKRYILPE